MSLGWKDGLGIRLRSYSGSHIDVIIKEDGGEGNWRSTGFYGSPVERNRKDSWCLLNQLSQGCDLPWLVLEDFNEICYTFEIMGGRIREER